MAFDDKLAARIKRHLGKKRGLVEKKLFGGVGFMLNGDMACGVHGSELIVRLAAEETDKALAQKNVRVFDLSGGRPMKGWILVEPAGIESEKDLAKWVDIGAKYAAALPPK